MLQRISSSSVAICQNIGSVFVVLFCSKHCDAWRSKIWMIFNLVEAKYQLYGLNMLRFETATHRHRSTKYNNMYKHIFTYTEYAYMHKYKTIAKAPNTNIPLELPNCVFWFWCLLLAEPEMRPCRDKIFFFRLDTNVEECEMIGYVQWFWKKVRMAVYFATWEIGHWEWVS